MSPNHPARKTERQKLPANKLTSRKDHNSGTLSFSYFPLAALQQKIPMISRPSVIIFDVDGVLVDTRESFQRTTLETVELLTGKRVTRTELHCWKNRPGFNDDWKLSHAWVRSLGGNQSYEEVKRKFVEIYWGRNHRGNVSREKWLLPRSALRRLGSFAELAIFTGRIRRELNYTLDRWK